jgi:methyl-accepting chemotaxis protein
MPKRLTQNINNVTQRIKEIADGDGDLTARIDADSNDEIGDLAHEFNHFVDKLQKLIGTVQTQSVALGSVTGHLIDSAKQTESITQALGHASDSTVSAGNEMSVSNQDMATMAEATSAEARHSDEITNQGISAVKSSHKAINELVTDIDGALNQSQLLEQSSENIASVLEVIRTIAEQTNLLALNAAIEAARAGEQGRGFAVVADEVRTLATRTQDSTNDIQEMIEQLKSNVGHASSAIIRSKERADETVAHIDQVNTIFNELQVSFAKVQDLSSQTAKATQEQSDVSNMISQSMASLNEQTNAAKNVVDASRKQADEVESLYQSLDQVVGRFKI